MKSESNAGTSLITLDRLREVLDYDPATGVFTWKISTANRNKAGSQVSGGMSRGRIRICIDGVLYFAHRLAWMYIYGELPKNTVDHVDQIPSHNAIANLRIATNHENSANRPEQTNSNRLRGVRRYGNKYISQISYKSKSIYLGLFDTPEEAHKVFVAKHLELHGEFSLYATEPNAALADMFPN